MLTTLSTVGFGDYHPRTNAERTMMAFIMVSGVAIFSFFMNLLIEILSKIKEMNDPLDKYEDLGKFFGLLKGLNRN